MFVALLTSHAGTGQNDVWQGFKLKVLVGASVFLASEDAAMSKMGLEPAGQQIQESLRFHVYTKWDAQIAACKATLSFHGAVV